MSLVNQCHTHTDRSDDTNITSCHELPSWLDCHAHTRFIIGPVLFVYKHIFELENYRTASWQWHVDIQVRVWCIWWYIRHTANQPDLPILIFITAGHRWLTTTLQHGLQSCVTQQFLIFILHDTWESNWQKIEVFVVHLLYLQPVMRGVIVVCNVPSVPCVHSPYDVLSRV